MVDIDNHKLDDILIKKKPISVVTGIIILSMSMLRMHESSKFDDVLDVALLDVTLDASWTQSLLKCMWYFFLIL